MGKFFTLFTTLVFLILISGLVNAYSVTLNFAYHLGDDKNDTIRVNNTIYYGNETNAITFTNLSKKFISSNDNENTVVSALVYAGSAFINAYINTTYSANDYLIQMKQEHTDNRFLFAFTKGTWSNIDSKISSVGTLFGRFFGDVTVTLPGMFPLFVRLEYDDINISGTAKWESGSYEIKIENNGTDARNNPRVNIKLRT